MQNLKTEDYYIGDVKLRRLIDEENEFWYPLKSFCKNMLLKDYNVSKLAEGDYNKFMKVFEYIPLKANGNQSLKTWFINSEGMYLFLQDTYNRPSLKKITQAREIRLAQARKFFNVSKKEKKPIFLSYIPDIEEYDIWSLLCLQNDPDIKCDDVWKLCEKCGYYYPLSTKYFQKPGGFYNKECNQCKNKPFHCDNNVIQYIYDRGGIELLYAIHTKNKDNILEELEKFIEGGV